MTLPMRRALPFLAAVAAAVAHSAAAADDPRMVERLYDEGEVVTVVGKPNVQAVIQFGEDEMIENIAIGDSTSWQVTPNKRANLVFVKPLSAKSRTNLTVVTNRHLYLFDLVASATAKPLYVLRFAYPEPIEPAPSRNAEAAPPAITGPNAVELAAAEDPYAVADPAALNFRWGRKGDVELMPAQIYDNGEAVFLAWPINQPIPAILMKDAKGTEGPVNFASRDDVIVVDGVPAEIVLRHGDNEATLVYAGPPLERVTPTAAATNSSLALNEGTK